MHYKENRAFIDSMHMFNLLTSAQKESLVAALVEHKFSDGAIIMREGDPGDLLYIVKSGSVSV